MDEKIVYLAGKVMPAKWEIAQKINETLPSCKFICSDEHEWEDHGIASGFGSFCDIARRDFVQTECIDRIRQSELVIAYLDGPDSFGSIGEIAYASCLEKPVYVGIVTPGTEHDPYELQWHGHEASPDEQRFLKMHDAYWFISHFPFVTAFDDTSETVVEWLTNICKIESPIEHLFYRHLHARVRNRVQAQYQIGKFRTDFAFVNSRIAIEIDGHAYHSSKEQRTYDAQRDRAFLNEGWTVMRFTGSEVFKNPQTCAFEASNAYIKTLKANA